MDRTRIVRWLRVLLPLLALAILSTMFLFSRGPKTEPQIPYATVDAEAMAREPRIVAPEYSAVTGDGAELTLRAAQAAPAGEGAAGSASDVRLDWQRPDGLRAELTAPAGRVEDGVVGLRGGVRMATSSGWTLRAPAIDAATDRSRLAAGDGVEATAPFGRIEAGRMELVPGPGGGADDAAVLNFSGGVRLIYRP
ncbi:hypothetical protein JHW45_16630 [Paracoccus stylophorae]|uniref:Lipopolysaccharide export system protein LptC n=1 Tax=Paracoccus stylophorae TaxID=659350 RepID=A0ABY7SUT8_9RHOB|nr:hypothetical protein [Paracoccus stylophorae]WCR10644.1 hypothetical protein JHW45_16630 [Paracoccus stylophorae]